MGSFEDLAPQEMSDRGRSALLERLDGRTLELLRCEFARRGTKAAGVCREQFLACVRSIWPGGLDRRRLSQLQHVFDENDLDASGSVRWDQFSGYLCRVAAARERGAGGRSDLAGTTFSRRRCLGDDAFGRREIAQVHDVPDLGSLLVVCANSPEIVVVVSGGGARGR